MTSRLVRDLSRRLSAWAGLLSGLVLDATFTIEGALRPGYDADSRFISELSLGPRGLVQKLNFWLSGALLLLAARGFEDEERTSLFLSLAGAGLLGAGLFDTDPFPRAAVSLSGLLHDGFAFVAFLGMILGGFACSLALAKSERERAWSRPIRAAAWLQTLFFLLVAAGLRLPWKPAPELLVAHVGTLQRLAQLAFFGWFVPLQASRLLKDPQP